VVQVHLNARQNDFKNFSGRIKLDFMRQHDMIRKQKKTMTDNIGITPQILSSNYNELVS